MTTPKNERFDSNLQSLLNHKVATMDEFCEEFQVKWPQNGLRFVHPFAESGYESGTLLKQHYLELLIANGVTTDYCVRCYCDTTQSFGTFTDYWPYYEPVVDAIEEEDVEKVKLLLSNSVILEPDLLLVCIISDTEEIYPKGPGMYRYLISLKPTECIRMLMSLDNEQYSSDLASEEFSRVTLQQLCRTAIRRPLRDPSLGDNLRNFRRKILELPLPDSFKDYLSFKN